MCHYLRTHLILNLTPNYFIIMRTNNHKYAEQAAVFTLRFAQTLQRYLHIWKWEHPSRWKLIIVIKCVVAGGTKTLHLCLLYKTKEEYILVWAIVVREYEDEDWTSGNLHLNQNFALQFPPKIFHFTIGTKKSSWLWIKLREIEKGKTERNWFTKLNRLYHFMTD